MKTSKKFFFLILFFSIFILIPISSFSPYVSASDDYTTYISASDILKNFKFDSIGDEPIVDDGAFDNKLRFDTQASWILYKNDVKTLDTIEENNTTYLKYRITLRNRINIYTNVRVNEMAQNVEEHSTDYLGMEYLHKSIENKVCEKCHWFEYITWEHYDFGDVYHWNWLNNYFNGRITMSFDIDDNPIPETFGSYTEKNFDYIAVSEAGIIENTHGLMSTDMPEIVILDPSEGKYEGDEPNPFDLGPMDKEDEEDYTNDLDADIKLTVPNEPTQSFDSGILPDTAGSSMNPKNRDGSPIWDPEDEKSMTDCIIHYDLGAISPVVYKYIGVLTYNEYYLHTEHEYTENLWDFWATYVDEKSFYYNPRIEFNDVALHGINRYIQVEMYVAFDIWASVNIGTLTEYYEHMQLEEPKEYYDALIWSTLAGGWTGSRIYEGGDPGDTIWDAWEDMIDGFFGGIFGGLGDIVMWILILAVIGIGAYMILKFYKTGQRRR